MLDLIRQHQLFDPRKISCPTHIIGVGATGSYMTETLSKMGLTGIHVWDDDKVEVHNIPNQLYGPRDIGQLKVDALSRVIRLLTGANITRHPERVYSSTHLDGIIFLLVDSMKTRKQIWDGAIKHNPMIPLMIETRLGGESGHAYTVNPNNLLDIEKWEASLFTDEQASEGLCGSAIAINHAVKAMVALAVNALVQWSNDCLVEKEVMFCHRPTMMLQKGADWKELRY